MILLFLVNFAVSSTANALISACDCAQKEKHATMDHGKADHASSKMPCHEAEHDEGAKNHAEMDPAADQMADDAGCMCGQCLITNAMVLSNAAGFKHLLRMNALDSSIDDFLRSIPPFKIDYPPQQIS
jgi:hypothetical protein